MKLSGTLALAICLLSGCARGHAPAVGAKVVMPSSRIVYLSRSLKAGEKAKYPNDFLQAGDLVEVIEVGRDFAAVDLVRDKAGDPAPIHGYVERWW